MDDEWKRPSESRPAFSTLVEILRHRALQLPGRRAYTFLVDGEAEEVSLTYEQLDRKARAIGAMLQELGLSGERALLLYPSGLQFIEALFGCFYAGVVAVPAYPPRVNRSLLRLQTTVEDAQAGFVLTTSSILSKLKPACEQAPVLSVLRWLDTEKVPEGAEARWRQPSITGETLAFLQYTSGSTSAPKGVMVSHGNLIHNEWAIQTACLNTQESTFVSWLPVYHDMGLIGIVLQALYVGASCILMSPLAFLQRPLRWLAAISRYGATLSGGPNFAYDLCVRRISQQQRSVLDLSSWKIAFNGSEPIRAETVSRFAAAFKECGFREESFFPCYGLAEATLMVSGNMRSGMPLVRTYEGAALERNRVVEASAGSVGARALVGCGYSLSDQKILIVDPLSLAECPADQSGEIWVSGPSVAQGYWNREAETLATFRARRSDSTEGRFLRTGDLGFLHAGELFVTGRLKDVIVIRGRNIHPQDIEDTVGRSHPALRPGGGAAFSVNVASEERLVVVQEVDNHRELDMNSVIGAIRQAIAEEYDVPVFSISLVKPGNMPKTTSGKLQRGACRDSFLNAALATVGEWRTFLEPATEASHEG